WNGSTTFTFDKESIVKESDDTANYPLSETEKAGQEDDSIYDSEGKLKDGTYTVTMSNTSRMYRQYPDNESAAVHIVSKDGEMRVSFVMKTTTSFGKLSLTDPESAEEYYLGTVGEGTAYCVPLASLDGLTAYFSKQDATTWNGSTTFTFDKESIVKESNDTVNYPLSETEKTGQEEDDSIYDSEGKLKDGTYTVTMSNTSRMYRQYPDNESAAVHIVSKDGEMRVSFVMKTTTSFGKLSLTDPETAKDYYLGTVGEGTAYCVPLASLDGLTAYFTKGDGESWTGSTTFTFDAESIVKESNDTANYPLSETEKKPVEAIDLTITNKTGMFKVTTASLVTEDGQKYLVFALSGKSYDYMFPGTFEEASANGDGTEGKGNGKWLHYTENADGKWEFKMPVTDDMLTGENIPMVSISNAYYDSFLQGKNKLERAFFPRQFKINEEEKTLETGDYDVNEALTVTNNAKDLTVDKAELNTVGGPSSNNYAENLIVTLKETGFDKAFIGSAADAAAASETIAPAEGAFTLAMRKNEQGPKELFNYLEQNIVISFHDSASDTWKEYKVNASKENMTLTVSALAEGEEIVNPTPAPTPEPAKTDGTTAAVDSSTGLPDGNYTPDAFSFSGGTGKLNITCTNISVRNGQAYATLQLSSKNITYVKAAGGTFYTQPSGSGTTVEIPVELNKNNRILALTTAMSTPHEVEYSIFPYLAAAAGVNAAEIGAGMTIGEEGKLDDKAPVIPGLTGGEEMKLENSEYLKIFKYDGGISLIEIDMTKNSVLDPEYLEKHKDENADDADTEEAAAEEEIVNEETGEKETKPAEEYVADQYRKDIVKYLVAPEKAELPAGLEKQVVVIRRPVENLYASSEEAAAALDKLGLLDMVKTLGMEEEDIENETLKEALKDEKIFLAGKADEPDYKTIVKEKTGMGFMTGTLLPLNEDVMKDRNLTPDEKAEDLTTKEYRERLYGMTDKCATLGIPVLMDRSADEKDEKGAAEWIMVYGLLFDKEEEAKTILDNTLKELD
ncbi:MAG: hypothetical protein IKG08_09255, partial [Eubacterium sp.]|nr:hypothetical protein [Eubacterium sp.]